MWLNHAATVIIHAILYLERKMQFKGTGIHNFEYKLLKSKYINKM